MKKVGKPWFFVVALLILALSYCTFFGVYSTYGDVTTTHIRGLKDIRFGVDIRGGVSATFGPAEGVDATADQIDAAAEILKNRLIGNNVTDFELYPDRQNKRIIVSFPWKDGQDRDPKTAIEELAATAHLLFIEGVPNGILHVDSENSMVYDYDGEAYKIAMEGRHIDTARVDYQQDTTTSLTQRVVAFKMTEEGRLRFADSIAATVGGQISIWLDGEVLSAPTVSTDMHPFTGDSAIITSGETSEGFSSAEAARLVNNINAGALPFALQTYDINVVQATLGKNSLDVMLIAGLIAFVAICVFMMVYYKLPGFVASIALIGQVAGMFAFVTGFFNVEAIKSFTLTLPGIAGIILSIGMGVDANIITAERIKEEVLKGKTLDGAIDAGDENSFSSIFDGNITQVIVAIILMGVFGPPGTLWKFLMTPFLFMFPVSTTGTMYSFGYTVLIGVLFNFIMGVTASRLMLKSLSRFSIFRDRKLYGGVDGQ